jgi:hypothetical protein
MGRLAEDGRRVIPTYERERFVIVPPLPTKRVEEKMLVTEIVRVNVVEAARVEYFMQ